MRPAGIIIVAILLSGCALKKHADEAKMQVTHFHALLNAGNFEQISAETAPGFKWPARGPTFKDYLAGVHRKLGFCGSWRMVSYVEQWNPSGRILRLNTNTHCDNDDAQESFIFDPNDMKLRGYAINSRVLVTS